MKTPIVLDAIAETEAVLDQYVTRRGNDPDNIYGIFHAELDQVVRLKVSHLRALVALAKAVPQAPLTTDVRQNVVETLQAYHLNAEHMHRDERLRISRLADTVAALDAVAPTMKQWFATFGGGTSLARQYRIVEAVDFDGALEAVAAIYGYSRSGAVNCAFLYPIDDLARQIEAYGITEAPADAPLFDR